MSDTPARHVPRAAPRYKQPPAGRGRSGRWTLRAATMLVPLTGLVTAGPTWAQDATPTLAATPPADAAPGAPRATPNAAAAAPADAPASNGQAPTALSVLLDQANFWRGQQRYDQALASLVRAQKLAPDDPDLLALQAQIENEAGNRQAAATALARLRQVAPGDARVARIEQQLRASPIMPEVLAEARRLAQQGKQAEAIQRYDSMLKGAPPPDAIAIEYYQTLAGTDTGWQRARDALARMVRQNPDDMRAQLAYAQVLTYRDVGRADGISRLAALAQNPEVAEQATLSWRQALGWLPDSPDSSAALNEYLALHPDDTAIANKLTAVRNPLLAASPAARARIEGFAALNKGKLADAEKQFQDAIAADANDADATGGLGLVRLRQRKLPEAKTLLARAMTLDPAHKSRWQSALAAAANPGGGPNPAVAMINRGELAAAEREVARQAARGENVTGLQVMLGDAEARQGRLPEAAASYRAALMRAPTNAQALVGLAGVLSRQGRTQEAADLLDRAQATGNSKLVGQARAVQLREQAATVTNPATQAGLYQAAVAADPDNPWLRLDYARTLVKLGQLPQARATMADLVDNHPSTDALRAGFFFANETSDANAAALLIARLPDKLRTPEMRAIQAQAELQRQIAAAVAQPRTMARQTLLAMAPAPDPTGARGAALAHALAQVGDPVAAQQAIVTAQAATPGQGSAARLRYAGALLDIGAPAAASAMLAQIGGGADLSAQQRQDMTQMQAGLAVRTSDQLNEKGRQAEAYDQLAPLLAQAPENPGLNLALARLYQGARNPREALQIAQSVLRRDPDDIEARRGAVSAALALGDRSLAESLVQDGLQRAPNDPKVWMMSADVAKAGGFNGRALNDLRRARDLRLQQLGYAGGAGDAGVQPGVSLVPGAAPSYQPASPKPAYRAPLQGQPSADAGADGGADAGQDMPTGLAPPPAEPFARGATNAVGAAPSYVPQSAGDTAPADSLNGQELARQQQPVIFGAPASPRPVAFQQVAATAPQSPADAMPAQQLAQSQGYYNNPFRQSAGGAQPDAMSIPVGGGVADPLTQEIDQSIVALRDTVAPTAQAGFGFRDRSGDSGLDALQELTTPMEATYSPGGTGQLKLTVTPTMLESGTLGGTASNQQRFGTNALALSSSPTTFVTTLNGPAPGDQSAQGVGLGLSYKLNSFSADIGTTPLGFREENIIGGLEWAPAITDDVRLRMTVERRAMTDSLLSYSGVVDPRTGETWGGVTADHARANLEFSAGKAQFYIGGGGERLTGTNVAENTEYEFGAGGNVPVWHTDTQEVRVGLDLVYFGYEKNLRYFTLGQGGYFSPQSYLAALIPVNYKERVDDKLSYEIGAAAGLQSYREDASPYFPNDPALQSQLVAQQANAATAATGVLTQYPGDSKAGFSGNAHASVEYRISSGLSIGGRLTYEHSGDFDDASGVVFARYLFNGMDP